MEPECKDWCKNLWLGSCSLCVWVCYCVSGRALCVCVRTALAPEHRESRPIVATCLWQLHSLHGGSSLQVFKQILSNGCAIWQTACTLSQQIRKTPGLARLATAGFCLFSHTGIHAQLQKPVRNADMFAASQLTHMVQQASSHGLLNQHVGFVCVCVMYNMSMCRMYALHVYMYTQLHTQYLEIYVHMYVFIQALMHACMHACKHASMQACRHVRM